MKILFTGGGTGGHIFPIIAIKSAFVPLSGTTADKGVEFYYVGPDGFIKNNLDNIKPRFILAGKLHRYFSPNLPIEAFKTLIGIIQCFWHIFTIMPDVIFSKGGYGSFPIVFVGRIYRIPVIIHDSDAIPGITNRKSAKFAKKIILSFEGAKKYFKAKYQNKIIVIGNPVRKELLNGDKNTAKQMFKINSAKPIVLIMGSSQGAQKINELIINILPRLLEIYEVIHMTGEKNFAEVEKETQKSPDYHVFPFLNVEELKNAYVLADLIINRAGAGSIFEIAALGKPSILIPLENSASGHQKQNAYEFSNNSERAIVLTQDNLTPNLFLETIENLLKNPAKMSDLSQKAKAFYNPSTSDLIRDEILKFARKNK